jgi:hypothetical protein
VLSLWTFQISRRRRKRRKFLLIWYVPSHPHVYQGLLYSQEEAPAGGDETPLEDFSDLKKKKKKKDIPLDLVCLILPQENVTYTS